DLSPTSRFLQSISASNTPVELSPTPRTPSAPSTTPAEPHVLKPANPSKSNIPQRNLRQRTTPQTVRKPSPSKIQKRRRTRSPTQSSEEEEYPEVKNVVIGNRKLRIQLPEKITDFTNGIISSDPKR